MAKQERRLNKRFVTILTIVVMVLLTAVIAMLIVATSRKDPKVYADRGDKQMAQKNYKDAARNYMSAYRYGGKDPQWLLKVAEAQYQGADERKALSSLQTAVLQNPDLAAAQKRYLEILYEIAGGAGAPVSWMKEMEENADKLIGMITRKTPEKTAEKDPVLRKDLAFGYHIRGLGRYSRRTEKAAFEESARADIQRAIELDPKPRYVESLGRITLGKTLEKAQAVLTDTVRPAEYTDFVRSLRDDVKKVEAQYLEQVGKSKADSETQGMLGDFYYQTWGNTEQSLADFCRRQAEMNERKQREGNRRLEEISQSTASADEKRRARQRVMSEMTNIRRDIPEWGRLAKQHEQQAQACKKRALDYYTDAVAKAGNDTDQAVRSRMVLANYYLRSGQVAEAEKTARQAVQLEEKGYRAYRGLVDVLKDQAGRLEGDKRQAKIDETIQLLNKRVYEMPGMLEAESFKGRQNRMYRLDLMMDLTRLLLDRKKGDDLAKVDAAIKELDQSPAGESPQMYLLRGQRALAAQDFNTAIIKLEKADKLSQERSPQVKLALAELYFRNRDTGAAEKALTAGMALAPGSDMGLRLGASIYMELGRFDTALDYIDRYLSLKGHATDQDVLTMKLQCLVRLNRLADADSVAQEMKVLGIKLDWPMEKARLLAARGNAEDAEKLLRQRLSENPGDKIAVLQMMDLLVRQNKTSEAQRMVDEALAKDPKDKGLARAKELLAIGDPDKRIERLREMSKELAAEQSTQALAKAQEEKDPFTRAVRLFDQYAGQNDLANARKYLDEAMKLDPRRANALKFRFAMFSKDWNLARESADLAKRENLDGVNGSTYEVELANRRGWSILMDKQRKDAERLAEARQFFQQTIPVAQQVITNLPNDAQVHALLGEAYMWTDRAGDAETQIAKALELNPKDPYALRARSLQQWQAINQQRNAVTAELAQSFAQNVQTAYQQIPWDEWLKDRMEWLNQQIAKQREYGEDEKGDAQKVLARRQALRKSKPDDLENLVRLAKIYEIRDEVRDLDKSEELYREAYRAKPARDLMQVYYQFADKNQRLDAMEKFLTELAETQAKSNKGQGYADLAVFYLMGQKTDKAEAAFVRSQKVEDTPARRLELAVFYSQAGNQAKTVEWTRETLKSKADADQDRSARILMINTLLTMSNWEEAQAQVAEYQKRYSDSIGQIFQAQLAVESGKFTEAEKILTGILDKESGNADARNFRVGVYLYSWQLDKARADLEQLVRGGGRLSDRVKLIKLRCELKQTADAEREARELIGQLVGQSAAVMERVRLELLPALASALSEKSYEELLVWAGNLMPGYWGWPYERGQYFLLQGKYEQAESGFAQAMKVTEQLSAEGSAIKSQVADSYLDTIFKRQAYTRLIQEAEKVQRSLPGSALMSQTWQSAGYLAKGQRTKGMDLFVQVATQLNNNPLQVWQLTRNTVLKAAKPQELVLDLEARAAGQASEAKTGVETALASCYFAADQVDKGTAIYRRLADQAREPLAKAICLYILGQEYTDKKQYTQAAEALAQANDLSKNNVVIMNNLAYILIEYLNRPKDAFDLAQRAYRMSPTNADLLDTYGQVLIKVGRTEEGLFNLTKSVWTRESSASRYHLGAALRKEGRRTDAENQLKRALQLVGTDRTLEDQIRSAMK